VQAASTQDNGGAAHSQFTTEDAQLMIDHSFFTIAV
jgi:hypothetical protein